MIWIIFQLIVATVAGIMIPATVRIPESTLIPPVHAREVLEEPEISKKMPPAYLQIPSIDVNASIEPVGLTEKGAVDVPQEPELLGWFNQGPVPGEFGSAIIDGHRGWRGGIDAVFDQLQNVSVGDLVIVIDTSGKTILFEVYDKKTYLPHENPEEVFAANSDTAFLNLITCNGEWDSDAHTATERLVVFTKRIDQ